MIKELTSSEIKKLLKLSDCQLMHLRVSGKLPFKKKGNRYIYFIDVKNTTYNK